MKRLVCVLTVALTLVLLLALAAPHAPAGADTPMGALFLNVGKADAALLVLGDERYLIDTGSKDSYDQLERVLDACGVECLDGVIITHTDKDHVGGLKKLLKGGPAVKAVYAGRLSSEPSLEAHPVYEAAQEYEAPLTWLSAGNTIELDNSCVFSVLGPLRQDTEDENNNSLVLRLSTPEGDMLLTGDMEQEEEGDLLVKGAFAQAAVLKVAHHGRNDATSAALLRLVKPQWAVISTNAQTHPNTLDSQVLKRLEAAGVSVAVTQDAEVGIWVSLSAGQANARPISWEQMHQLP